MPLSRRDFIRVKALKDGDRGSMNAGIFLVRTRRGAEAIEKRFDKSSTREGHSRREIEAMRRCVSPYITKYLHSYFEYHPHDYGSIFMEFCELGSLEPLIDNFARKRIQIPEGFLWQVLWDISLALCYLQSGLDAASNARRGIPMLRADKTRGWEEIVHCDIKPANLFLTMRDATRNYPTVVLGDFGCCTIESPEYGRQIPLMNGNTSAFAPPEEPCYSDASDIYSLALSVHCMALRRPCPFEDKERTRREPLGSGGQAGYTSTLANLLRRMLKKRVNDRPDALYLPYLVWREKRVAEIELGGRYKSAMTPLPLWATNSSAQSYPLS